MDTIALDARLRHAAGFLGRTPLMLIDGKQVPAMSGRTFAVYNPATGGVIANVPEGDKADVDLAVAAARRAFDERRWSRISPSERGRILWRIADLIERNLEELAELESIDNGKPYAVARVADLPLAVICEVRTGSESGSVTVARSSARPPDAVPVSATLFEMTRRSAR